MQNADDIVKMLDNLTNNDVSRIKIDFDETAPDDYYKKEYHHGRCDVGSPWAKGCAFDVLEPED